MVKCSAQLARAGLLAALVVIAPGAQANEVDPRAEIAAKLPGDVSPQELTATPIPGLYELRRGMEIGYVTSDGRYYLSGELHDLRTETNLTEASLREVRRKLLATVPAGEALVFGPESKHAITVFTDVDCGYCRKLHNDVPELNRLGIQVRYLFYPRSGPGSPSWKVAEDIWCAANRNEALTRAKRGEEVPSRSCRAGPIVRQFALGNSLGIRGTPGIFTRDGDYLKGYLPPAQMLAQLERLKAP